MQLNITTAKKLYHQGGDAKDYALENFTKEELEEVEQPVLIDINTVTNYMFYQMNIPLESVYSFKKHFADKGIKSPQPEQPEITTDKPVLPKSWEKLETVSGFTINSESSIYDVGKKGAYSNNVKIFPTKAYAEASLAQAQLLQLRERWLTLSGYVDWNQYGGGFGIFRYGKTEIRITEGLEQYCWLYFPTWEMANDFLNESEINKLIHQAMPLL